MRATHKVLGNDLGRRGHAFREVRLYMLKPSFTLDQLREGSALFVSSPLHLTSLFEKEILIGAMKASGLTSQSFVPSSLTNTQRRSMRVAAERSTWPDVLFPRI